MTRRALSFAYAHALPELPQIGPDSRNERYGKPDRNCRCKFEHQQSSRARAIPVVGHDLLPFFNQSKREGRVNIGSCHGQFWAPGVVRCP